MNENLVLFLKRASEDAELAAKLRETRNPDEAYALAASVQGGIPAVLRLIRRWRNEYPTRKKMQEMLTRTEKQIRDM